MPACEKDKYSISEAFNNKDGKTSGSGTIGIVLGAIGGISFIATMYGYFTQIPNTVEVMQQIIILIGAASLLLGVRKFNDK